MENSEQRSLVPMIVNANESHMALVFLLDTSGSMAGEKIRNLNEGLNRFKTEVCKNEQTKNILDVAIIEFNSNHRIVQEFCPIEYMDNVNLNATGGTLMSPAIRKALEMVNERSRFYRKSGSEPYKPWVILISDGQPDSNDNINIVAEEIRAMESAGKVTFRSLGVIGYDPKTLHILSGEKVMKLEGTNFTDFFDWVNKSMRSVSQSSPSERPKAIPLEGTVYVDRNTDWD